MKLKDMTLNELWDLFPITFVDSNTNFKNTYLKEEQNLKSLLGNHIKRISHIGSTSIKNIKTGISKFIGFFDIICIRRIVIYC